MSLNDPEGDLWPVNAYSDADELNLLAKAAQNTGILAAEVSGARLYIYPMSISEPEPLLAVCVGIGPTLLGHELKLRERQGEDPVSFTLRLLADLAVAASALAAAHRADGDCLDRVAAFMNRPGQWSGADVCEFVAGELQASGRELLDAALGQSGAKRGALTGAALTDEVLDSSPSVLRPIRGATNAVTGLQQFFSPPQAAELIAAVNGRSVSTFDPTAGDGSLLSAIEPDSRFGVEIDADHVKGGGYEAIQGDVQLAYPLLRLLGTKFPRVACNPPFGLDWSLNGQRENSTLATWRMATTLLAHNGAGAASATASSARSRR